VATRRELIEVVETRYRAAGREVKKEILNEFVKVTRFHRKCLIRVGTLMAPRTEGLSVGGEHETVANIKEAIELYLETVLLGERDIFLSREILTTAVEVNI
jgi:hypothetical protein